MDEAIVINSNRYRDLIALEEKVNLVSDMIVKEECINLEEMLWIFGERIPSEIRKKVREDIMKNGMML